MKEYYGSNDLFELNKNKTNIRINKTMKCKFTYFDTIIKYIEIQI